MSTSTSGVILPILFGNERVWRLRPGRSVAPGLRGFMPFTTIRSTLVALIGSLGLLILALGSVQIADLLSVHSQAQRQYKANVLRGEIVRAGLALARERDAMFLALVTGSEVSPRTVAETESSFAAYKDAVARDSRSDVNGSQARMDTIFLKMLPEMRAAARRAMSLPLGSEGREVQAAAWFDSVAVAVKDLRAIRLQLLSDGDVGGNLFNLHYLRTLTLILQDEVMQTRTLMEAEIARASEVAREGESRVATLPMADIAISVAPFEELLSSLGTKVVGLPEGAFDARVYSEAENALKRAMATGNGLEQAIRNWRSVSSDAIERLDDLQVATYRVAQERVETMRAESTFYLLVWAFVLVSTTLILAFAVRVVLTSVVKPLELMRSAMLELANDNLGVALPKESRIKEISAMDDALRVFKANAIRRQNLQRERLQLHSRLEETYAHIKTDLEAAAVIQASLLPQQAQAPGVALSSYFRPSHFLAGDTFDVLQQPDGRTIVFQIDVAGHGAAAALVSVASKYTVAQAIMQRGPGTDLSDLVQKINADWPGDLPYFTLLIAEIDPTTGSGSLVQAGHPSPFLLRANGELLTLGDGGLPIGALAQATFDTISFPFSSNDRLVVTTDGIHEMENCHGEAFSEERLRDLLSGSKGKATEHIISELDSAIRSWRGDDTLDDDVTVVVLEGMRADETH